MSMQTTEPEIAETTPITVARQQLAASHGNETELALDNAIIHLTSLDKPLWPLTNDGEGITKRQVIEYYLKVADIMLPHLINRPLTLKRYPQGTQGPMVLQRHIDEVPEYVQTVEVCVDATGTNQQFLLCQNVASLVWMANLDTIEFHPWHSRINPEDTRLPTIFINSVGTLEMSVLNYPDWLVIDIDPSQTIDSGEAPSLEGFDHARQAADLIHNYLDQIKLQHAVKLSGQGGLHIFVPIKRVYTYDQVRQAARIVCELLAKEHNLFTTEWHVDKRQGRVFLDWQQNARGKSQIAPYSLRATPQATISWPIHWKSLPSIQPDQQTLISALIPSTDPWNDISAQAQELPESWLRT
jgi:bifunctional non-homologous end joining protein LigD